MIKIEGIDGLLTNLSSFTGAVWIFTTNREDQDIVASIMNATFYTADDPDEDPDEEIAIVKTHYTFLEFGIFTDVVMLEREAGRRSPEDIAAACLYYLERDTFRD